MSSDTQQALKERLALYEDWNARLQLQLQQLLRLPQNDTQRLASKMYNSEIAIPLLQCYDAAILEKQEENDTLREELKKLKSKLDSTTSGHDEALHAARLSEELAKATGERLQQDHLHFQQHSELLQSEIASLKSEVQRLVESESAMKASLASEKKKSAELQREVEAVRIQHIAAEESLNAATKKLKSLKNQDEDERHVSETQKIQLHLVSKENDDKLLEIERLRGKMVHALKQQQENHATHLKIVEEKHRGAMEALREEHRAQEVQLLKLRAQLARVNVSPGGNGQLTVRSTAEVLDSQSRHAQDMEVKRLYAELTAAQLQRDDAVYRFEQLLTNRRAEAEDRTSDIRRELESQRLRTRELEERCERLEGELNQTRDQLRSVKEKAKNLQSEVLTVQAEKESFGRRAEESKKLAARLEAQVESLRAEKDEAVAAEKKTLRAMERKMDELRQEEQTIREKLKIAADEAERRWEAAQQQLHDLQSSKQTLLIQLSDKDRVIEQNNSKADKLSVGIKACKEQLMQCDERLVAYANLEQQWKRDARHLALQMEQLKMEVIRATREKDRLLHELQSRKF